jgi:hypothetical protein
MFVAFMPLHILIFVLISALDFMLRLGTVQNSNLVQIQIDLLCIKVLKN